MLVKGKTWLTNILRDLPKINYLTLKTIQIYLKE